jgi:hypothetical protein
MVRRVKPALGAALALLAGGCDLAEVITEPGEDVVAVETVLRTDRAQRPSSCTARCRGASWAACPAPA